MCEELPSVCEGMPRVDLSLVTLSICHRGQRQEASFCIDKGEVLHFFSRV
jgi:hypothetical protein